MHRAKHGSKFIVSVLAVIPRRFPASYIKLTWSTCCSDNCAPGGCQSNWHQNTKQNAWSQHWQLWTIFSYTLRNSCKISVSILRLTERRRWVSHSTVIPIPGDQICGLGLTSLLLTQRTRVRSPDGSVFLVRFFRGFSSTVRQMSGKLRYHLSPDIIGHHNIHKLFHKGANDLHVVTP